jgi:hypothetical protein
VRDDVALRLAARVAAQEVPQTHQRAYPRAPIEGAGQRRLVFGEQRQQCRRIGRFPHAAHVCLGKADVAPGHDGACGARVANVEFRRDAAARTEGMDAAIGKRDREAAAIHALQERKQDAPCRRYARRREGERGHTFRVTGCDGGAGFANQGTRRIQSFAACQWMRATTPSVNQR